MSRQTRRAEYIPPGGAVPNARPVHETPGFPQKDRLRRLNRIRTLARVLDTAIQIPGTRIRFGADSIIGLIPGVGDLAGGAISAYILVEAAQMGVPRGVLLRMLGNLAVDMVVGSVPVLGDIFDVAWKANRRNLNLVETYLRHANPHGEDVG